MERIWAKLRRFWFECQTLQGSVMSDKYLTCRLPQAKCLCFLACSYCTANCISMNRQSCWRGTGFGFSGNQVSMVKILDANRTQPCNNLRVQRWLQFKYKDISYSFSFPSFGYHFLPFQKSTHDHVPKSPCFLLNWQIDFGTDWWWVI